MVRVKLTEGGVAKKEEGLLGLPSKFFTYRVGLEPPSI